MPPEIDDIFAPQIRTLLSRAQQSVNQANTDVTFKRPDRAYVEYLISSEILLNVIPHHKDYPVLISDRGEWSQIYKSLCKVSRSILGPLVHRLRLIAERLSPL